MSARATAVLDRFPCHLALADPGKRFRQAAEAIAADLDVVARQIGDVRRAHRLGEAPTRRDVVGLGAIHALSEFHYQLVELRTDTMAGADPDDSSMLAVLTNLAVADLDSLPTEERRQLIADSVDFNHRLEGMRSVVRGTIEAHRLGNGTATSLLAATAAYLGFDIDPTAVKHYDGRWWHTVSAIDTTVQPTNLLSPRPDLLAVEENPFVDAAVSPVDRNHGDRFGIRRGGLEDVSTSVVVVGKQDRTVGPMVVNLDAGQGVVFEGSVDDGLELVFHAQGQVTLDEIDVTGSAFAFSGGVFADRDQTHSNDFVFATVGGSNDPAGDRVATWVVSVPITDGLDQIPTMPHGGLVDGLPLALGESRWAAFARHAHFGTNQPGPEQRAAVAGNAAGRFDSSVFALSPGEVSPAPFAAIGFRWSEREPFALRVLLPQRLAVLDDEAGTRLREPLRAMLDRHRAAGVHLTVTYGEPQWDLGHGIARDIDSTEPLGTVVVGTTLWPDGTTQPTPI